MGVLHRNNVRCPGQNSKMIVVGDGDVLRYCRNVRPTWVRFDSKDTKESGSMVRGSEY